MWSDIVETIISTEQVIQASIERSREIAAQSEKEAAG